MVKSECTAEVESEFWLKPSVYSENLPPPIPIEHGSGAGLVKAELCRIMAKT
jgi:hypothetical protein